MPAPALHPIQRPLTIAQWAAQPFILAIGLAAGWFFCTLIIPPPVNSPLPAKAGAPPTAGPAKILPAAPAGLAAGKAAETKKPDAVVTEEAVPGKPAAQGPPKNARDVIQRLLEEAQGFEHGMGDAAKLSGRLQQLKEFGEEASKAIQEFLRTQQDVAFNVHGSTGNRVTHFNSLRAGLLEVLYDLGDPTAKDTSLEILKSSSAGQEVMLAARNLEKMAPGAYRAEALQAATEIMNSLLATSADQKISRSSWAQYQIFEMVGYYQAKELLPQAEELLKKQPRMIYQWLNCLSQFSGEEQVSSLKRAMNDEGIRKNLLNSSFLLGQQLNYQEAGSRQVVQDLLGSGALKPQQKEQLVQGISQSAFQHRHNQVMRPMDFSSPQAFAPNKARVEGALKTLDEIGPQMDTPQLKQQWEQGKKQLQEFLKQAK